MTIRLVLALLMLACASTAATQSDQTPKPGRTTVAPEPPPAQPLTVQPQLAPPRRGQLLNVKVDVTITDQAASRPAVVKNLSVIVADARQGMIRTEAEAPRLATGEGATQTIPLHIDARPTIEEGGKIRLGLSLSYIVIGRIEPVVEIPAEEKARLARGQQLAKTEIRENLELVLENGKPMIVAQSADPLSDRKVAVEVKATILR